MQNCTVSLQTTNIIGGQKNTSNSRMYCNSGQKTHVLCSENESALQFSSQDTYNLKLNL